MWCLMVMISTGPTLVSARVSSTIEKIVIIINNNIFVFSHYIIIYSVQQLQAIYLIIWCRSFSGQILFSGKDIWVYWCIVMRISKMHVRAVDQDLFEVFCPLTAININEFLLDNKSFTGSCKNNTNDNGFAHVDQIVVWWPIPREWFMFLFEWQ